MRLAKLWIYCEYISKQDQGEWNIFIEKKKEEINQKYIYMNICDAIMLVLILILN